MFRPKHRISVKVAIYSYDNKKVLILRYPRNNNLGLPGGHLEYNELPDEAMVRELQEELGVTLKGMKKTDFFIRKIGRDSSIILGYTAIAPRNITLRPPRPKYEFGEWVGHSEIKGLSIYEGYKDFILENWPA